ncbi:RHOMBOID-like protein 10, chloroplastic isoform X2 [Beta vulgaris subsp. vulgaris]|uniref:RHOMBOID-like protein 10, chloroplastic isoform X2 n=1 Tax=Beta vulgaris subsp. vulgaris TaxID=3555 RepID=UPI0020370587|nr:RHOMBOID-like protein 10, chloroplastic isoform X2 [Beta vulgaris subsp. vulgaris]
MILGFGGGALFPLPRDSGNDHKNWFPLSKAGPSPTHLFSTAVSLRHRFLSPHISPLLCSAFKGTLNRRGCYLKQFHSFQRLDDVVSAAWTSCFCLFDGNSGGHETGKKAGSSKDISRDNPFLQGGWTNSLLAINVLLYVAQMATQGRLMLWGAKINSLIDEGQLWRLVTSAFLHANIGHLLVNCYSLHSVGPSVEKFGGTQRFFTIYFASAITSSAMSYWLSEAPAVGASGAIFGLVGSVAVFSIRHRSLRGSGAQDLKHIAQVILLNIIIGLSSSGIDNWGHLGGFLGGVAVSLLVGPAWTYDSTTRDGRQVFVDKAPIFFFNRNRSRPF